MEQHGTGTQKIQDGISRTLQDMNLCANPGINLEVGWPPALDQAVTSNRIAISNIEGKIQTLISDQTNNKEELLSALKTLLKDIDEGIERCFRENGGHHDQIHCVHKESGGFKLELAFGSSSYRAIGKYQRVYDPCDDNHRQP